MKQFEIIRRDCRPVAAGIVAKRLIARLEAGQQMDAAEHRERDREAGKEDQPPLHGQSSQSRMMNAPPTISVTMRANGAIMRPFRKSRLP